MSIPKALRHVHPVFYFSLLKRDLDTYTLRPEKPALLAIIVDGEDHHKMAELLDSKIKHNTLYY